MSPDTELIQPELFGQDEPPCPGYDVCPIGICGCRFLGLGTPFASDVKKVIIYADSALHGNDDVLSLTHREAITQTGNGDTIMNKYNVRISYNNNGSADESHHIVYSETRSNAIIQARKEFKTARREYMKIKIGKISAVEVICG